MQIQKIPSGGGGVGRFLCFFLSHQRILQRVVQTSPEKQGIQLLLDGLKRLVIFKVVVGGGGPDPCPPSGSAHGSYHKCR